MVQVMQKWLLYLFGVMILLISFSSTLEIVDRVSAFRYYHRTVDLHFGKTAYKVTEPLDLHIVVDRYLPDNCNSVARRFIFNRKTKSVVYSQIVPSIAENGKHEYRRFIYLPPDFPPGEYLFQSELVDVCRVATYRSRTDFISFDVVAE